MCLIIQLMGLNHPSPLPLRDGEAPPEAVLLRYLEEAKAELEVAVPEFKAAALKRYALALQRFADVVLRNDADQV